MFLSQFILLKSHIDISDPDNMFNTSPRHAATTAANGLQSSIIGTQLIEKIAKDGAHKNVDELVNDVTALLSVKKQIAIAEGKALAFIAIDEDNEEAYAAVDTRNEDMKPKLVCEYCVKIGKTGVGHETFLSNGGVRCRELARELLERKTITDEQCQACIGYAPKRRYLSGNIRKEDKYSHSHPFSKRSSEGKKVNKAIADSRMRWTSGQQNKGQESAYVDVTAYISSGLTKSTVVADTGATAHLFNDKRWFLTLQESPKAKVSGVGGTMEITHRGMTVFGMASYAEALPVSLLSTNQLHKERKEVKMAYEPEKNAFKIRLQGKWLSFRTSKRLNVLHRIMKPISKSRYNAKASLVKKEQAFIAPQFVDTHGTLEMSQDLQLTKQQVDRAKAARKLHQAMNHPGDTALSRTLMRGHIADTPVTAKDIVVAEKILGPCPACTVSKATTQVRGGQYNYANEIGQHLRCDIAFIGGREAKTPFHFAI